MMKAPDKRVPSLMDQVLLRLLLGLDVLVSLLVPPLLRFLLRLELLRVPPGNGGDGVLGAIVDGTIVVAEAFVVEARRRVAVDPDVHASNASASSAIRDIGVRGEGGSGGGGGGGGQQRAAVHGP